MFKVQNRYFGRKAIAVATLGALVVSTMAPLGGMQQAEAESMSADGYVTAAATRAAQTAPEILGLTGVEETSSSTGAAGWGNQDWTAPKYYIFGDTTYNTAANPYMVNAVSVQSKTDTSATPTIILNESREGGGRGPMGALAIYGADSTDNAVWDAKPDVVIGTGTRSGAANYDSEAYIGSDLYNSGYHPKGVAYYSGENANIIKEMYAIAKAADEVVKDSNGTKKLRYNETATEIATNYEKYVRGTQGLILKAIDQGKVQKKTIALVNAYDSDSNTYTLTASGASLTGAAAGTSDTDHYLDMTDGVTNNLANTLNKTTVTESELEQADVILVGGNSVDSLEVASHIPDSLLSKTYYTDGYNAGAIYDVMHNAVDNVQNAGRILGFVYPTVVDQDDWVCYYYNNFYHVKSDSLADAIDKAMDGVRNYDADGAANRLQWSTDDASTYNSNDVQQKLDEGFNYIEDQGVTKVSELVNKLSSNSNPTQSDIDEVEAAYEVLSQSKKDSNAVSNYEETVEAAQTKVNQTAAQPVVEAVAALKANSNPQQSDVDAVTKAYNKLTTAQQALVEDYDSVVNAAQAKVDAAKKTVTKKANTLKVAKSTSAVKVGKNATVKVSGAQGTVAVKSSKSSVATAKYSGGNVTITGKKAGSATITVTAAGNGDYNKGTKTIKVTVSKNANTLKVAKSKISVKKGKKATVKVTKAKGTVSVKSSKRKVATVKYNKKTGKVTITAKKKGTAKITVTAKGNSTYAKGTKTIKVTVKK